MFAHELRTRVRGCTPARRRLARGLSIVELMVGVVIALMVGLAATTSAVLFNAAQRQGVGTGGALVNAGSALAAIKDDAAAAGLGFFGDNRFLCTRLNLSVGTRLASDNASFTPVQITRVAGQDTLDVVFADEVAAGTNVLLDGSSDGNTAAVMSLMPASVGQAVLLAPPTPGDACVVRSVTEVTPSTDEASQMLAFGASGSHNQGVFTTPVTYADQGRITLLGTLRWSRFRLDGTNLVLERPLEDGNAAAVLARNVMAFRVQYGVAAAGTAALASWEDASGTFATLDAVTLPRVRALRIALLTRSAQPERVREGGGCEASTALPQLLGVAVTPDVSDWQCYRYRSAVAVVPLQNFVMGVTP